MLACILFSTLMPGWYDFFSVLKYVSEEEINVSYNAEQGSKDIIRTCMMCNVSAII